MTSDMRGFPMPARGTVFPGAPSTDDQFYRTDRNILYFFNGTRWLTANQYVVQMNTYSAFPANKSSTTNALFGGMPGFVPTYDFWMEEMRFASYVATTNNSSNYWVCDLYKITAPSTSTNIVSSTTAADTANTWTQHVQPINALLGTDVIYLQINAVKILAPGNFDIIGVAVVGRLVG